MHNEQDIRFLLDPFRPAYQGIVPGELEKRVDAALRLLSPCRVCSRRCEVNRLKGETGFCAIGRHVRVASAFPHHGEEAVLSGWKGSGAIFLSGCNLHCIFCQNADISHHPTGPPYPAGLLAELMLELQAAGCHNLNFVSPSHVVPQLLEAIAAAVPRGLRLPIVYNSSGYDSVETLRLLDGVVDIYMPDFKFQNQESSERYSGAKDYPERAMAALLEMHRQTGVLRVGPDGLARRGVLVRHLVLPSQIDQSIEIMRFLAQDLSPDTYVNIMAQYRPEHLVPGHAQFASINRRPRPEELEWVYRAARQAGLWRLDAE